MDVRKRVVSERLVDAALDEVSRSVHPCGAQIVDDGFCLLVGSLLALLRMDGFEHAAHVADFGRWHVAENVPIEMNHATLPLSLGQIFRDTLRQTAAGVGDDELHATVDKTMQER